MCTNCNTQGHGWKPTICFWKMSTRTTTRFHHVENVCLVSWAAVPCVWTIRGLTRNLLTYYFRLTIWLVCFCPFFVNDFLRFGKQRINYRQITTSLPCKQSWRGWTEQNLGCWRARYFEWSRRQWPSPHAPFRHVQNDRSDRRYCNSMPSLTQLVPQICINILSRCRTSYSRRIISCSHG